MKMSIKNGIYRKKKKAQFMPNELEDHRWEKKILSYEDPESSFRTLVYKIGLHFGLRARESTEHLNGNDKSNS